ncbi:centromere protein P [Alligator sinensis]|uniref:Centromere protein P n=1 Tax=Alligator sinensis TaxID=38654 RepID=A0A1U7S7Y4_ALLSI|nr:centromere protein P [Alligator sinensis]XP_025062511.1 centromere protein P [Alligator sinensis]XP_025062512.1 centromere protein P [Alligator sinensis]XP_025062513.1 centromere protein P [Alligator sinensis]XP_025062514.1 centromere protein P [Alligator sinensis]XP_025062515.1 centromere protein P [Alligator sinensis]XP_025062516.1 centromere protein P [Alligator sinensis]XP_025062517.1 centromere protein P [Alligator sinensis]XP_025062518.1 centromere protein P [Alligator sinensis]
MESNIYHVYENEIQSLEEEIETLAQEYENNQLESTLYSDEKILMPVKPFQRESHEEYEEPEFSPDLKAWFNSLESDLSFLMKFTGICPANCSRKTLEKTGNKTIQNYRLSGNCHSLPFDLEFQLLEIQSEEGISAAVTDLSIITESDENCDISKIMSRAEEEGNLLLFFRAFSNFAQWCKHRKCTFLHFKAKYPDIVTLPEGPTGDYMIIKNPELSGFELMIIWKIAVNEEGTAIPVLDLLPKIPAHNIQHKAAAAAENAPGCFRIMLRLLGIEASIDSVVKSFAMETE